ncbi:MAG: SDR family oxidoreductase [Bacteroidetes bacterium]|nr:SDR family oxidoreductase [Bacteroidota bacterium]
MTKTIFITGASSGLGKTAAKLFASRNWKVIATMRNLENGKELSQIPNITLLPLDVTDPLQIEATVRQAIELGGVDAVLNNAGYGLAGPIEAISDEQLVKQINTNILGVMRVTRAFIPYFRERKDGLFITITSIGGLTTYPLFSAYHATKWALEGWNESLSFELKPFGIKVKTLAPGGIDTDFSGRSAEVVTHEAYLPSIERLSRLRPWFREQGKMSGLSTPESIAEEVYQAVTDGKDQVHYLAGPDAKAIYRKRLELGAEGFKKEIEQMFFE